MELLGGRLVLRRKRPHGPHAWFALPLGTPLGVSTCLEKSLAPWWLLARQGIPSSLRIGTRKADGQFEAHAWIEYEGAALNELDEPHRHYAAFDAEFPPLPPEAE